MDRSASGPEARGSPEEAKSDRGARGHSFQLGEPRVDLDEEQQPRPASFIFRADRRLPEALVVQRLESFLRTRGVPDERIRQAKEEGTLDVLALESVILSGRRHISIGEAARRSGISEDILRRIWRSFGFPEPSRSDEPALTEEDLDTLSIAKRYLDRGVDPHVLLHLVRIIGSSLARIAEAEVAAVQTAGETLVGALEDAAGSVVGVSTGKGSNPVVAEEALARIVRERVDELGRLLDYGHRRHLIVAARRQVSWQEGTRAGVEHGVVGFADLVGFTAMSQQLDATELAERVERFGDLAYEIISRRNGRVVKMIGDEVMFVFDDTIEAARAALELVEVLSEQGGDVSSVRVGLSKGELVFLDGDYYGPVVNLASRIVKIALASTVVVSQSVYEETKGRDEFELRAIRPRRLKGIGRVQLWSLRRPGSQRPLSARDLRQLRSQAVSEIFGEGIE